MSKTQYVLERLRAEIFSGAIDPGSSLRQVEIAKRYGVSPTPVREALRLLEAEGSIEYSPHLGATIRELSPAAATDLYLLRAEVEGLATSLAAERRSDADLEVIRGIQERLRDAHDAPASDKALMNRQFHLAIFNAGSETVAAHAASLWSKFPPALTLWGDSKLERRLLADHDLIVDALERRDAVTANRLGAEHVLHAKAMRSADGTERPPASS